MKSENLYSDQEELNEKTDIMEKALSSKASPLSFSLAWMNNLTHRFIVAPLIMLFAYFLCIHLPVIMNFTRPAGILEYSKSIVDSSNLLTSMIVYYASIVMSAMVFDYLHQPSSATAMHSMPFTRGKLFRSSVLTGYIMLLIPILLSAIGMFVIARFIPATSAPTDIATEVKAVYSLVNVVKWTIDMTVLMTVTYAIANFAGIVAGSVIMHVLMAFLFESLPAMLYLLFLMYKTQFIYGTEMNMDGFIGKLMPSAYYVMRDSMLSMKDLPIMAAYVAVAIVITVISGILYKRIKLERERSTSVFPVVSDFIVILFTFAAMSLFGMLLTVIMMNDDSTESVPRIPYTIACAISSVAFFIVFRMIADSTVKVINLRSLLKYVVFAMISAVIFAVSVFDVLDVTNKVPIVSDVKNVKVKLSEPFDHNVTLSGRDSVEKAVTLHKTLLRDRKKLESMVNTYGSCEVRYTYNLKSGSSFSRVYQIPNATLDEKLTKEANDLMTTDENWVGITNHIDRTVRNAYNISISTGMINYDIPKKEWKKLVDCYLEDYKDLGFTYHFGLTEKMYDFSDSEELNGMEGSYTTSGTAYIYIEKSPGDEYDDSDMQLMLPFGPDDERTISFLKKHGHITGIKKEEKAWLDTNASEG